MSDRPINLRAPEARALLDGRKSMTRRVLKLAGRRPDYIGPKGCTADPTCWGWDNDDGGYILADRDPNDKFAASWHDFQSSYAVGDRLWVREAFRGDAGYDAYPPREWSHWPVSYEADPFEARIGLDVGRLRPSIHMPRWASRLTLTVTDVRVQRLQGITEADAIREGVTLVEESLEDPREAFRALWNSIHGPEAWDANPWCVAISFDVKRGNIDAL